MDKPDYKLAMNGLEEVFRCVAEFHDKMQFTTHDLYDEGVNDEVKSTVNYELMQACRKTGYHANKLQSLVKFSTRATRGHLCCEEVSELMKGLAGQDEEQILDALCDLLYVVVGTAVVYDLPLGEGFLEVHTSNMTKEKQTSDPYANRVRDKGPNYQSPDLKGVLERWHQKKAQVSSAASSTAEGAK